MPRRADERQSYNVSIRVVTGEQGNIIVRSDSVSAPALWERPKISPEVAAILMRELEAGRSVPVLGK